MFRSSPLTFARSSARRAICPWLTDWSNPPVKANYLAFGYTGVQGDRLVLSGWLYNVGQPDPSSAQVIGKLYYGTLDAAGAKKVAREFAADILQQFGAKSLDGSKIYFVSDRTGNKEIWSMDYDGSNQHEMTHYKSVSTMPTVSPDGKTVAFTTYALGNPKIMLYSKTETDRQAPAVSIIWGCLMVGRNACRVHARRAASAVCQFHRRMGADLRIGYRRRKPAAHFACACD